MNTRIVAAVVAGLTLVAALAVLADRSSLIAGLALVGAAALLLKLWRKPSSRDLAMSLGIAAVFGLAWMATFKYVIATYESGEVVELAIATDAGEQTVRLWVMDMDTGPVVYYDAPPAAAAALLAGRPLQMTRAGVVSQRTPRAARADALPAARADQVLQAMEQKYGDRIHAATVFYLLLGNPRDRVPLVATLVKP